MHSSFLQFGHLHIPVFGVAAALGLMAALALSQRTARNAKLDPEIVWNVGMTAIVAAFVVSRLLLVAFNWHSFVQYPLLLMALPSLTFTGVLLTAVVMLVYLRWRRLPLLPLLDAAAPCGAMLWAFLSAGRFADGTRDGMPTEVTSFVARLFGLTTEPVEVYTLILAAGICMATLTVLSGRVKYGGPLAAPRTDRDSASFLSEGFPAGMAMAMAGLGIFLIDLFRLPSELVDGAWIDPAQIMGVALVAAGSALMWRVAHQNKKMKRNDAV